MRASVHHVSVRYSILIMIDRPYQKRFDFPEDKTIDPPPYQRDLDTKYDGISPRDAFNRLQSLTQNNKSIEELAPYVVEFMQHNKDRIYKIVQAIALGNAIDRKQKENAWVMLSVMRTQNDISNAFALWELNITPIPDEQSLWPSHESFIKQFHRIMGRFRSDMANLTP